MPAVVVIPHDVSAFEAALGDVMQTVGDVNAAGARHSLRPDRLVLRSRLSSEVGHSNQISKWPTDRLAIHWLPRRPFWRFARPPPRLPPRNNCGCHRAVPI